jgi:hypothetical protein
LDLSRTLALWGAIALAGLVGGSAGTAAAQARVAAEAVFRAGREASARGDHATACEKYRESYRIEKALGTLLNIAVCEEALGQLASAWQHYQEVLHALPPGDERLTMTRERLAALDPRLPRLTVQLAPAAPADTRVTVGTVELSSGSFGVPLPWDPGHYELNAQAEAHAARSYGIDLAEGDRRSVVVEPGAATTTATTTAAVPVPAPIAQQAQPQPVAPPPPPPVVEAPASAAPSAPPVAQQDGAPRAAAAGDDQRAFGYAALVLGGLSLTTSAITFAMALDRKTIVDRECPGGRCNDEGFEAKQEGTTFVTVGAVSLGMGVLSTAAGIYLLWTAPDGAPQTVSAQPLIGPGVAGVTLRGAL